MKLKNLFQILVNPKGSVNYIEYRVGIIALFMILGVNIQYTILTGPLTNVFMFRFFVRELAGGDYDASLLVAVMTLPAVLFVPATFLTAWGSIILTYKRFITLGYSKLWGGILGCFLYLGLACVERFLYIFARSKEASQSLVVFTMVGVSILMLLALAVIVFSWVRRSQKEPLIDYGARTIPMNIHAYVMKMGKWMLVSAIVLSLIPTLAYTYISYEKIDISKPLKWGIVLCYSAMYLMALCYYLRYAYFRLIDTGYRVLTWLVIVPITYLVCIVMCVALFYFFNAVYVQLLSVSIILNLTVFMMAYPLLLLVLPSQNLVTSDTLS